MSEGTDGAAGGAARAGRADVRIARATKADLARVLEIERQSFSDPWSLVSFRQAQANPRVYFGCARATDAGGDGGAGALVGYVVAWFVADEGEVANLAVAPEARGRGVGAALLDAALAHGERQGTATMYLEVRCSNHHARRLYGSRGFEEVGRRKHYYRRPAEDAVVLRRTFPSAVRDAAPGV